MKIRPCTCRLSNILLLASASSASALQPPSLHLVVLRPATQFLRRTVPLSATLRWAEQDGLQLEEGSHEEEHSATLGASNPYAVTAGSIPYSPAPVLRATIAAGLAFTVTVTLKSLMPHMRTLGALYSGAALASPLMTAATTATLKGIVSDVFAQLAVERRNKLDVVRTACFVAFNFIYLGLFNSWKYGTLYAALFGKAATVGAITCKVCARDIPIARMPAAKPPRDSLP